MKKIILTLSFLITACASAQVAIGKTELSSPSASLEFYDGADNARGMVLPWVDSEGAVSSVVDGTIVYDTSDKKVKVKYASGWKDLSVDTTGVVDTTLQDSLSDITEAKTSIGTPTTTPGILVLEDTNKAMILPKVASPHLKIVNPAAGMVAYDTVSKQLAVFNGTVWSFWKP